MDGVALSFLSSIYWRTPEIKGTYIMLSDDGELEDAQVEIPNVSFDGNIGEFKKIMNNGRKGGGTRILFQERTF